MPDGFRLPINNGFWTALTTGTEAALDATASGPQLHVFGRLRTGVDATAAQAQLAAIGDRLRAEYPQVYAGYRPAVLPYIRHVFDVQQYPGWVIWLMQLFAGLIVALVAVNVAVLVYARTALRRAEITVRTALGASRGRIVTQLFVEALALSGLAALAAVVIARIGFRQMTSLADISDNFPYWLLGRLPPQATLYAAVLAVLAALVVGVVPALEATRRLQPTLRELGGGGLRMGRTWTTLICVQVAVAVAVLPAVVGIAWNSPSSPRPAFPASETIAFQLHPSAVSGDGLDVEAAQTEMLRRVAALPDVAAVTFASSSPHQGAGVRVELESGGSGAPFDRRRPSAFPRTRWTWGTSPLWE
jgi:cell division protein FtsX